MSQVGEQSVLVLTSRGGFSAYYPKLGIKVSKLFDGDGRLLYWYNDISELSFVGKNINFTDLLIDLVVLS